MSKKATKTDIAEALVNLHSWLKPGDTVYTILRHTSRSGMLRRIGVVIMEDGFSRHPDYAVNVVVNGRTLEREDPEGVPMGGAGMDMGFALVYNLSYSLFPDGFDCIGKGCPSNDHSNRENNSHHKDGGYALRQRWL